MVTSCWIFAIYVVSPYCWGFVGVFFSELDSQFEGTILERRIVRTEYDGVPQHDVVVTGGAGHACSSVLINPSHDSSVKEY